jgi:hypothetical protein
MRAQSLVPIFTAATLLLFSCSGNKTATPTEVHVKLSEFKIEMDKTNIPAGPVNFIIDNAGMVLHEVV